MSYPPTIVVIHPRENRAKCSLEPLRGRADLKFARFPPVQALDLSGYLRLAVDGPPLSRADAECGLLLIDGTWRLAERMHQHFAAVPPRSLKGFHTGYPRVSKTFSDPPEGLASAEALYIAYCTLGRSTDGLLEGYRWAGQFLQRNGWR